MMKNYSATKGLLLHGLVVVILFAITVGSLTFNSDFIILFSIPQCSLQIYVKMENAGRLQSYQPDGRVFDSSSLVNISV